MTKEYLKIQANKYKLTILIYEPFEGFNNSFVPLGESHFVLKSNRVEGYKRKRRIKNFIEWTNYNKPCGVVIKYHCSNLRGRK